jgi:hypothetical protein
MTYKNIFSVVLIGILAFITAGTMAQAQQNPVRWVVEKNSTLRVDGKSNVNSFTCNITEYTEKDTLILSNDLSRPIRLSGDLQMNVMAFNCHSSLITKDLRKTLKSEEYPRMIIRFLSLNCMPSLQNKCESIKGWVEVELAGTTRRFELSYTFSRAGAYIQLNGGRNFCFSDFKLSPPRKLAGLIKIKDDFDVNFQLLLRPV